MRVCDGLHECSSLAQWSLWSAEADPSKQLPCPWEDQQHSAQGSAALSSYSSECQEFIWIKLKVSWIWLPSPQLSNRIHEQDSHALTEKDKQDASTRVTGMKEMVFEHSLNSSLLVLWSTASLLTLMDLARTVCDWVSNTLNTETLRLLIPNQCWINRTMMEHALRLQGE